MHDVMEATTTISERLESTLKRIDSACERSGRDAGEVTLVGVSKKQPLERLREGLDAGLRVFGESHVQEAISKNSELRTPCDWHLIGPLQSNKAKLAARLFSTIHSVDRHKVARLLDQEAGRMGRPIAGFIEINLASEPTKHGFEIENLGDEIQPLADYENLRIVGLMAIPPYKEDPEDARGWFRKLRELRDELRERPEWNYRLGWLSMGMSHDFEVAIEEGATHVRVGTAIFGERPA